MLTLKKNRIFKGTLFLVFLTMILSLSACYSRDLNESETEWLRLRIIDIYDYPQEEWDHTITACSWRRFSRCRQVEYVFNHLHLGHIEVSENSVVRVEVSVPRILPLPAPLFVRNWELAE